METATLDDPVALARDLIRCPSVTPRDAGALDLLQSALEGLGLVCHRLPFGEDGGAKVDNLYARIGTAAPNLCFAGHTDVVPPGDLAAWSHDPFAAEMAKGRLFGRGATDMKGAVACFIAALARFLAARKDRLEGSVSLLITGDEEGPAVNGTVRVLEWLAERGERLDACLVGEPTSVERLGDTVKIGRRGSLTGQITVHGVQGHTAYPNLADNPIPRLIAMLSALMEKPLDAGSAHFQPSTLEVTTIDVGNPASNLIPAQARASFNIRYNDLHTGESLTQWLRQTLDTATGGAGGDAGGDTEGAGGAMGAGAGFDLAIQVSGDAFLCPPGRLSQVVCDSIESVLKLRPELSTAGGTSDARFIHHHCPVAEFGLPGITMHKVDEGADLADLHALTEVYEGVLDRFFAGR